MKGIITAVISGFLGFSSLISGSAPVPQQAQKTPTDARAAYNAFISAVDTDYAYNLAVELAENEEFHNSVWGDRTAGSDAEHKAADWLAGQMRQIGLTDVVKEAAKCDIWQFNGATLQLDGDSEVIYPHSYATASTPAAGINAEVVYVGKGTKYDYEDIDVTGKIVLIDIDQRSEWWITYPMLEAQYQGAVAILSANTAGFSEISPDAYNAQDICGPTAIPCLSISLNDSAKIQKKLAAGKVTAKLTVDNVVVPGAGTTYNVMGKIKGKSSENQIIIGAHYDMHFKAFQDDSAAVGLVLAMAKAMKDSNYVPGNDIIFCLHGAEEWGASNTMFDWTVGAWEMINTKHPDWQQKTLAFINFELPAYEFDTYTSTYSAPEMYSMLDYFTNEYPLSPQPENCFPDGVLTEGYQTYTYSDDFSYYIAGVPSTVNGFLLQRDMETVFPFYYDIYHSNYDTKDTYNENVMDFNIKYYGALAMYIDQTPALYLDYTSQFDRMTAAMDERIMKEAGADVAGYKAALAQMNQAAIALRDETVSVNEAYRKAVLNGADETTIAALWAQGKALTKKNLAIFNFVQDAFLGLMYEKPVVPHEAPQINIDLMQKTVELLQAGDGVQAADEYAWQINNVLEWYVMYFSPEVIAAETEMFWGESNRDNLYWGTNKMFTKAVVQDATRGLIDKYEVENADFAPEIAIYQREIASQRVILKQLVAQEIADLHKLTAMLKQ